MSPRWRQSIWVVLFGIAGFFAVTALVYISIFSLGNPVDIIRLQFKNITPAQLTLLRNYFESGYFAWLGNILTGNFGFSARVGQLGPWIQSWTGMTLELVIPALLVGAVAGLFIGVISTRKNGHVLRLITLALLAVPAFWLGGLLLLMFSFGPPHLPSFGASSPFPPYYGGSQLADQAAHLVLPLTAMSVASSAMFSAISAWVARGFADVPLATAMKKTGRKLFGWGGIVFALLLTASLGVETVFGWPGLGYAAAISVIVLDIPAFAGIWVVLALAGLVAVVAGILLHLPVDATSGLGLPKGWREVWHSWKGKVAAVMLAITLLLAVWGALFAPLPERSFQCLYQGCSSLPPFVNLGHPLGTEISGIDVLSESLHGLANDLAVAVAMAVIGLLLGSVLGLIVQRIGPGRFFVWGAICFAVSVQAFFLAEYYERMVFISGGLLTASIQTVLLGGILASLPVAILASRYSDMPKGIGILKRAIPGALLVTGVAMLFLQYLGFFGFLAPSHSSLGLLMQEGFSQLRITWWVWVFPGLMGGFAVFSLFILGDTLLSSTSEKPPA